VTTWLRSPLEGFECRRKSNWRNRTFEGGECIWLVSGTWSHKFYHPKFLKKQNQNY